MSNYLNSSLYGTKVPSLNLSTSVSQQSYNHPPGTRIITIPNGVDNDSCNSKLYSVFKISLFLFLRHPNIQSLLINLFIISYISAVKRIRTAKINYKAKIQKQI